MAILEIDVHRYHISLVSGSISYGASSSTKEANGVRANIHPALLDPSLALPDTSATGPVAKKRKRQPSNVAPPSNPLPNYNHSAVSVSEADLMAFHQSRANVFASFSSSSSGGVPSTLAAAGPSARRRPTHAASSSSSPTKTRIPLSSPSHVPLSTRPPPPLVPYPSSSGLGCSSSFDGALAGTPEEVQDAMDEDEVDELATVPRPVRRGKGNVEGTPTGAVRKGKGGVGGGRVAALRGEGARAAGVTSPFQMLSRVNTPLTPGGDTLAPGTTKKKKTKPIWQVNTPPTGYPVRQ